MFSIFIPLSYPFSSRISQLATFDDTGGYASHTHKGEERMGC